MQLVQATGLTKTFSGVRAVDDVSLTVARGEVVGFLGPNGAGKSTTMKMLTGFLTPDAGTASIAGEDVFRRPLQARARLGYLPEGAPAYGDMSVGDFLVFIGRMRGLTGARLDERLAEMVERDRSADMIDSTIVRAHHCAVGIKRGLRRPRRLADRAAASPQNSMPYAMRKVARSASS